MIAFIEQLIQQDGELFSRFLVLFSAIVLSRAAPLPKHIQPMFWLSRLAKEFARKANHPHRASSQQVTAGFLASTMLIVPFWVICAFLLELAAFPWFFEFIILYLCLSDACFRQFANEIHGAIKRKDKVEARNLLGHWVAQDTQTLSEIGLAKTTIEKLAAAPVYGLVSTIFYYTIAGAPLVLAARMIKQLELSWPVVNPRYQYFGRSIYLFNTGLQLIPNFLWGLTLASLSGPEGFKAFFRFKHANASIALDQQINAITASSLKIELGGPRMYAGKKAAVPKLIYGPKPGLADIKRATTLTSIGFVIWFAAVAIIPTIWAILRYIKV